MRKIFTPSLYENRLRELLHRASEMYQTVFSRELNYLTSILVYRANGPLLHTKIRL